MNSVQAEKPIRVFIAIHLPPDLREKVTALQRQLQRRLREGPVRWVSPTQIHLTLRFLGDVPPSTLPCLQSALTEAATGSNAFQLAVQGLGCFPSLRKARIIWLGVVGQLDPLRKLQSNVERTTAAWGEDEGRPFHPHLTIGRAKQLSSGESRTLQTLIERAARERLGAWDVTELALMQSQLSSQGPRYEQLGGVALHGSQAGLVAG